MKKKTVRRQNRSNRRTKRVNVKRRKSKKMRRMHGGATTEQIGAAAQMREVIKDYILKNKQQKDKKVDNSFHLLLSNLNGIVHCGHDVVKKKVNKFYDNMEYNYDPYAEEIINNAKAKIIEALFQEVTPLSLDQRAQLELAREKALRSNPNPGVPASRSHSRSPPPQSQLMPSSRSPPPQSMQGSDSPASSSRFSFSSGVSSSRSSSSSPVPPSALKIYDLQSNDQFPVLQSSKGESKSRSPPPTPRP